MSNFPENGTELDITKRYIDDEGDYWEYRDGIWGWSSDPSMEDWRSLHPDYSYETLSVFKFLEYSSKNNSEPEDVVNRPSHYQLWPGTEALDVIRRQLTPEEFRGYLKGNIFKYRLRAGNKDDAQQDIEKAKKYAEWLEEVVK